MKFSHIIKNVVSSFVFALLPLSVSAKCGNVDYSWGADALAGMHDYVVTMMLYVLYLTYAVAAVMVIISALQIYIKMNTGEDGVTKSILTLIGACLFMIGASILFPAFLATRFKTQLQKSISCESDNTFLYKKVLPNESLTSKTRKNV